MNEEKKSKVLFVISSELSDAFTQICNDLTLNKSEVLRTCVQEFVESKGKTSSKESILNLQKDIENISLQLRGLESRLDSIMVLLTRLTNPDLK